MLAMPLPPSDELGGEEGDIDGDDHEFMLIKEGSLVQQGVKQGSTIAVMNKDGFHGGERVFTIQLPTLGGTQSEMLAMNGYSNGVRSVTSKYSKWGVDIFVSNRLLNAVTHLELARSDVGAGGDIAAAHVPKQRAIFAVTQPQQVGSYAGHVITFHNGGSSKCGRMFDEQEVIVTNEHGLPILRVGTLGDDIDQNQFQFLRFFAVNGSEIALVSAPGELEYCPQRYRIAIFNLHGGAHLRSVSLQQLPQGLVKSCASVHFTLDGSNFMILDNVSSAVHVVDALSGALLRSFGSTGNGEMQLDHPNAMCLSVDGKYIFVADARNRRVQVWQQDDGAFVTNFTYASIQVATRIAQITMTPDGDHLLVLEGPRLHVLNT